VVTTAQQLARITSSRSGHELSERTTVLLGVSMRRIAKLRVYIGPLLGWSSAQSDYDHGWLRLFDSLPRLRLAEVDMSSVTGHGSTRSGQEYSNSARSEYKPRCQSPSCCRTYTSSPSREDSSETEVGQSTSTRSRHKLLALPEVCTGHDQREYDCRNHDLVVHCMNLNREETFFLWLWKNCRNSLWVAPKSVPKLLFSS
jgi:hypothetical protein